MRKYVLNALKVGLVVLLITFLFALIVFPFFEKQKQSLCRTLNYPFPCKSLPLWDCHEGWGDYHCHKYEESRCTIQDDGAELCINGGHIH